MADLLSFYKENVSGTELESFFAQQAKQYVTNQILPKPRSAPSVVSPTPQVVQVSGSPMGAGVSKNTWIYIGVGGAVALVALIVLLKK